MQRTTKRRFLTPDELRDWSLTRGQIGDQLKKYYQACTTEDLPPRLLALVKKLDEEQPEEKRNSAEGTHK
jgi:hypothetical protein